MWNVIADEAWTSETFWSWYSARRAVERAADAMNEALGALGSLIEASNWHARGAQALRALLEDERAVAEAEVGALHGRIWEIERLGS